ncbi:hypothetical protein GA0061078_1679 [Bifidobacterium bohemicum]|uniref:Uncharacterized protein n=1 Tax=Bifidobacterium bohemicum DSM 22767 TaxID=1437606 RepID=A0A086ZH89_9BIFI|nr:hypothetical protein [Bifidobacterium bohemicum]KFI45889.1 hypothetical protein BBOH_0695 [Bifidobacterium bohemicum DSM 22767]SCC16400.1 hypothetical protein GA0061078_1679 [Bifidobacterium bohemicum]
MARKIELAPDKLEKLIQELGELNAHQNEYSHLKTYSMDGSGSAVSALQDVAREYVALGDSLQSLFDKTREFLTKANSSMKEADRAAGSQFGEHAH